MSIKRIKAFILTNIQKNINFLLNEDESLDESEYKYESENKKKEYQD